MAKLFTTTQLILGKRVFYVSFFKLCCFKFVIFSQWKLDVKDNLNLISKTKKWLPEKI